MQISFENSFDHWLAFQIFYTEQLQSLKRHTRKHVTKIVFWVILVIVLINIVGYDPETFELMPALIPFVIFLGFFMWLIFRNPFPRKSLLRQFTAASKSDFEQIGDTRVTWEITEEALIISEYNKQIRYNFDSIESITICPQYLFVRFGFVDYAYLPAEAINPEQYRPFCEYLVRTYQACTIQAGKPANIIQSDWSIDMDAFKKGKSCRCTGKKLLLSMLWGLLFVFTFTLFCGLILVVLAILSVPLEERGFSIADTCAGVLAAVWFFGSVLMFIGGVILGLTEKLPGTKTTCRSKTPTPQNNRSSVAGNPA